MAFFFSTMSCAGQRPVVRPWRWAWAGEEWGQGPTGPWLLYQELGAAGGHSASLRRHLVWAVVPPRLPLASPPLALRRPTRRAAIVTNVNIDATLRALRVPLPH